MSGVRKVTTKRTAGKVPPGPMRLRRLPKLKALIFPAIDTERERRSFLPFEMEEKFNALLDELGVDEGGRERVTSSVVKAVEKVRRRKARGK